MQKNKETRSFNRESIKRLLYRSHVERISENVYSCVIEAAMNYIRRVAYILSTLLSYQSKKTLKQKDIYVAMEILGVPLIAGISSKTQNGYETVYSRGKIHHKNESHETGKPAEKKKRRKKQGQAAKQNIKKQIRESEFLSIPKSKFEEKVKQAFVELGRDDIRFGFGSLDLFQLSVEVEIIRLCTLAEMFTEVCERKTMFADDVTKAIAVQDVFRN